MYEAQADNTIVDDSQQENEAVENVFDNPRKGGRKLKTVCLVIGVVSIIGAVLGFLFAGTIAIETENEGNELQRSEAEREAVRLLIAENTETNFESGLSFVVLRDVNIGFLPNEAFSLVDFGDLPENTILIAAIENCSILDVEENALVGSIFSVMKEVSFSLANNKLTTIPPKLFSAAGITSLGIVDFSNNLIEKLSNVEDIFQGATLDSLVLDGNRFRELPLVSSLVSTGPNFQVHCNDCFQLELVQQDYCLNSNVTTIFIDNTPIRSTQFLVDNIREFTGCVLSFKEQGFPIVRVGCENILEVEREMIRVETASSLLTFNDEVTITVQGSCLPFQTFKHIVLPESFNRINFVTENDNLEIEAGVFEGSGFEALSDDIIMKIFFNNNDLTYLSTNIFTPLLGKPLIVNLAGTHIEDISNSEQIFFGHKLVFLQLSQSPIRILPRLPALNPSVLELDIPEISFEPYPVIFCDRCDNLEQIDSGYCTSPGLTNRATSLVIPASPVTSRISVADIAFVTECLVENIEIITTDLNEQIDCEGIIEIEREFRRKLIAQNAEVRITQNEFIIEVKDSLDLRCLPSNAFSLFDFSDFDVSKHDVKISLINLNIVDIEEAALSLDIFAKVPKSISIDLSGNGLTTLPSQLLSSLSEKNLISFDVRNNQFSIVENSEELFEGTNLQFLSFDSNPITTLPVLSGIAPNGNLLTVSCEDCSELELIDEDYCLNSVSRGSVILNLIGTPLSDKLDSAFLSVITGCPEESIQEDDLLQRELIDCSDILEIERQQLRKQIAQDMQLSIDPNVLSMTIEGSNFLCIPDGALSGIDFNLELLPPGPFEIKITFQNCQIAALEPNALDDSRFGLIQNEHRVSLNFSNNNIAFIPSSFLSVFDGTLSRVDFSSNPIQIVANDEILFKGTGAQSLDFSDTQVGILPLPRDIDPSFDVLLVSCFNCANLLVIEDGYCNILLQRGVTLDLRGTPIVQQKSIVELVDLTGCIAQDIIIE